MVAIYSKDRTQAIYTSNNSTDLYARYVADSDPELLYRTGNKMQAYEIWQMVGGEYGDFEICEVES